HHNAPAIELASTLPWKSGERGSHGARHIAESPWLRQPVKGDFAMTDHRSLNNRHEILGTDQVLDGDNVRDRFLTAFILRHGGVIVSAEPRQNPFSPGDTEIYLEDAASFEAETWAPADRELEPLTIHLVDPWATDGDDET
ncbi:MAG TPA: hypothetical protein VKM72_19810, partial [Thermoanaerobaculia bacterium]|nr:hypothetical protein [Thermoanaerobaculia bacterium]